MYDEEKFKSILRKVRENTAWEAKCSIYETSYSGKIFEVSDAENELHLSVVAKVERTWPSLATTHLYTSDGRSEAELIAEIFDWLLDEAEHDPDR